MHHFKTVKEAQSAGFVLAVRDRQVSMHRGCRIYCADAMWSRQVKAPFSLRAEIPDEYTANYLGVRSEQFFGSSEAVRIEVGDLGSIGAMVSLENGIKMIEMFTPPTLQTAIDDSREWIDKWFRYNASAMERAILRRQEERRRANEKSAYLKGKT